MTQRPVRVRFAPSPTGPLHMGGVRTALYNYLFARRHGGTFILRIEDTDQNRLVLGAEDYIVEALKWCGLSPDESSLQEGNVGPYRQSERQEIYGQYAEKLVASGHAYYAFDTEEEIAEKRAVAMETKNVWQYDASTRSSMRNSTTLSAAEVDALIKAEVPFIIRFKMPDNEDVIFTDLIREEVKINTSVLDDKVLMKADGMPTYHLANIVDDHLMEISHVIRGEEWLPSAPLHVLLYQSFGWTPPSFAHLPLILKPTGNGKLSKRDGDKGGFPVFPLTWKNEDGSEMNGYRESGYFPEAFINMLLMLGWNPGTEQEMFTLEEMCEAFSLDRVVKSGARFNPDKAKWFNENYLRQHSSEELTPLLQKELKALNIDVTDSFAQGVCALMAERVSFVKEMTEARYFFVAPTEFDEKMKRKKWKPETGAIMEDLSTFLALAKPFDAQNVEHQFKTCLEEKGLGFGAVLPNFRLLVTGTGMGPSMFETAALLGKEETLKRIKNGIEILNSWE
jgi:glutamyl-tRNA synthetase